MTRRGLLQMVLGFAAVGTVPVREPDGHKIAMRFLRALERRTVEHATVSVRRLSADIERMGIQVQRVGEEFTRAFTV